MDRKLISFSLPMKMKIAVRRLYNNYKEYISAYFANGGIIEASP